MTEKIDARGLRCPLPVLKLEKWLDSAARNETVIILVTDPVARIDVPHFCNQNGHACSMAQGEGHTVFTVTKGGRGTT